MHQFIFILLLLLGLQAKAQQSNEYLIREFSTENGLPSNGIKGLKWDEKHGFLWIATEAGVARFNGIDFKTFSKSEQSDRSFERVLNLTSDDRGNTYAIDLADNIYKIEGNLLRYFGVSGNNQLSRLSSKLKIKHINEQIIGQILRLTESSAIPNAVKIVKIDDQSCLIVDNRNNLWHFSSGIDSVSYTKLSEGDCKEIFKTGGSVFMLTRDDFIYRIVNNQLEKNAISVIKRSGEKLKISKTNVFYWDDGMADPIWFNGENTWLIEWKNGVLLADNIYTTLPENTFIRFAQYYKKGNILFVGTDSKGIIVITKKLVTPMKAEETDINERNAYYSQIKLNNNSVLTNEGQVIGRNTGGINIPIKGKFSFRIYIGSDSVLWYLKQFKKRPNVLHSYNFNSGITTVFEQIKSYSTVSVTYTNNKSYITTPEGTGLLEKDSIKFLHKYKTILDKVVEPFDLTPLDDGNLIFGTCNSLVKFNTKNNQLDTLFTLNGQCIRTLQKYGEYIFLGTYGGGIYIHKKGLTKHMPLDKNSFLLYTHCFIFDANGFCWMSTNRGLFKTKLSDLINAFEKNTDQVYYHYFGKADGMDITEMNGGCSPCALWLNKKTISFPTMDGLLWVNTESAEPFIPEGNIYIDEFSVNEKIINLSSGSNINLPAGSNEITLRVGYPVWCNKENIYLQYRLKSDDKWKVFDSKNESTIYLNNLPHGTYNLQIRKLNGFGVNNYSYKTISFTIAAPWYKQWWFYLGVSLTALGLIYLILKIRTQQLEHNQRKLETQVLEKTSELLQQNAKLEKSNIINNRLISIISHDIITPLKFLNVAGKNLLEKKSLMTEDLKDETIKEITSTSKELQLLSTNILNWIKYQNENRRLVKEQLFVHDMLNQIFGILNSMANQKNLKLVNLIDPELQVNQYFEPLKILIYNLITNAIHFSGEGKIIITAEEKENSVTIVVSDEGVGMTADQIKNIMADQFIVSSANVDNKKGNGLGYLIIKDLLKMMNAKLKISSEKNKGTKVYVELPE